jgi:molybdopterin converting factor small subunit
LKLLFYGRLADMLGRERHIAAASSSTIGQLRDRLIEEHEHAKDELSDRRVRVCVADALVGDDHVIHADDTVEFLPPVCGG